MVKNAQGCITIPKDTSDFIDFLHGLETPIHYIALPQVKTDKYTKVAYGVLNDSGVQELVCTAVQHKKCVSVAVNRFYDTGRQEKDLQYVNAFCIDSDGTEFPGAEAFPIKPDCVVGRDDKHWHAYWKIDDRGMTINQWREVQYMLALYFATDKQINATSLVLRLPGFLHNKNPKNPQVYKIKHMRSASTPKDIDHTYSTFKTRYYRLLTDSQKNELDVFHMKISNRGSLTLTDSPLELTDDEASVSKCEAELSVFPPAIEGTGGDAQTYRACCIGANHRIKKDIFLELLAKHYNPRCIPSWSLEELQGKIDNAYTYSIQEEPTVTKPEIVPKDIVVADEDWELKLARNEKTNIVRATFMNMVIVLRNHPDMKDKLHFDEFKNVITHGPIPFLNKKRDNVWDSEEDTLSVRVFLNRFGFDMSTNNIFEGVLVVAFENKINSAKDYFTSLTWDNVPRLEKVLPTYFKTEDSEYARIVGTKSICAAVARVLNPGVKFDTILIFEGDQGHLKSTGIEVLAGQKFFTDSLGDISNKDTILGIQGYIIAEIADLHNFKKAEINTLKQFLSRKEDKMRPPYGRGIKNYPRQGVFMGTTNDSKYLEDETGARRFWPVRVESRVDIEGLKRDRDQIWAEAVSRYMCGETLYITEERHLKLAEAEQEKRRVVDDWEDEIRTYLEGKDRIQTAQIWEEVFTESMTNFGKGEQYRVVKCLRNLGYVPSQYREGDKVVRGYKKIEKEDE